MEHPKRTKPDPNYKEVAVSPLVIPKEISLVIPNDFPYTKTELEISLPTKPEILRPNEEVDL